MKVAFTGHRPNKLVGNYDSNSVGRRKLRDLIAAKLWELHEVTPITMVITGGALGVDQDAARVAYIKSLPFAVYAPCIHHESKWNSRDQTSYKRMCSLATDYRPSNEPYSARGMQKRNEAMVNDCDILIAVWDGSSGGTANCVRYAKSQGKQIVYIKPEACN